MADLQTVRISPGPAPVTETIQALLDGPHDGIRIVFAAGRHRCGGLRLSSDTHLHLEDKAELHFIPDYQAYAQTTVAVAAEQSDRAMLMAKGQCRISLTGHGRIFCDGSRAFSTGDDPKMGTLIPAAQRPRVLVLDGCSDVQVSGLQINDSPMWTLHFVDCERLSLSDLSIDNDRKMPNTDGIVIDGCRDVHIHDCCIRTADDGIVLKTSARLAGGATGPCEGIHVEKCTVESRSCALKLGTESFAPFRDILFEDIAIEASNRGIGIFSRDGGSFADIRFSRISMDCHETPPGFWGSGEAITINTVDRRPEDGPAGTIRDVVIEDISGTMQGAINLFATRPGDLTNIALRRIAIEQAEGDLGTGLSFDLRPTRDDRFASAESAGRINAWRLDAAGQVIGLVAYPDGMPGVFACAIENLRLDEVDIVRPSPLPSSFNTAAIVETSLDPASLLPLARTAQVRADN